MASVESPPPTDAKPSRSARLLSLVRRLIDYGKDLGATLHQRAADNLRAVRHSFGTTDLALILLRIRRGLQLAQALETRLVQSAARLDAERRPRAAPTPCKPGAIRAAAARAEGTKVPIELPTEAEIAAWVRRKPIGEVIADICRDLGILCDHPLWRDLQDAITVERGNYIRLVTGIIERGAKIIAELWFPDPPASPAPATLGTGPP